MCLINAFGSLDVCRRIERQHELSCDLPVSTGSISIEESQVSDKVRLIVLRQLIAIGWRFKNWSLFRHTKGPAVLWERPDP